MGVGPVTGGLGRARGALDHRRDVLQVAGVGLEVDADRPAAGQLVGAFGPVVVLDVAGSALGDRRDRLERGGALELGEDRVVGAAEVVGQDVEPAAVGHPDDDLLTPVRGRQLDQLVEHRHGHVQPLDRELVLAQVGLVHEALERVDLDQPFEQRAALFAGQLVAEGSGLDVLAQPHPLAVGGDVLDLVGDRAAVGLGEVGERVREGRPGHVHLEDAGGQFGLDLGRQPERLWVEARVALGFAAERVEMGGEVTVAAHAGDVDRGRVDGVEEVLGGDLLGRPGRPRSGRGGGGSGGQRRWAELDLESLEDLLVEAVLAVQTLLDQPQEASRLGPLDDAVVVGGGHRHHLLRPDHLADLLEPDRVADRPAGDDRALARHQSWHRGDRAQAAGVGERDVRPRQVVGSETVVTRLLDDRVVGLDEAVEGQPPGAADDGHHQRPRPVRLLDVDRDPEVSGLVAHAVGLALDLLEVVAHDRHLFGRLGDRIGDQVGEGNPPAGRLELLAAGVEHGHGKRPEAGRRRDRQRLAHVAGERGGASPQELGSLLSCRSGARECGRAVAGGAIGGGEYVGLGDPARRATPGYVLEVHALGGGGPCGHR